MTEWPAELPDGTYHYLMSTDGTTDIVRWSGRWYFCGGECGVPTARLHEEGIVRYLGPVPPYAHN